jgi:hypothetical protein
MQEQKNIIGTDEMWGTWYAQNKQEKENTVNHDVNVRNR